MDLRTLSAADAVAGIKNGDLLRRMQGQAPFRVFLGNAPAVDLSLNQERFDHTPFHRRNSTARFSVGDRL